MKTGTKLQNSWKLAQRYFGYILNENFEIEKAYENVWILFECKLGPITFILKMLLQIF